MSSTPLLQSLDELEKQALGAFAAAALAEELEQARITYLGAKQGQLRGLQKQIPQLSSEEKPAFGKRFNEVSQALKTAFDEAQQRLSRPAAAKVAFDVTLPGRRPPLGHRHPLMQTIDEVIEIMGRLGFSLADGPEIEDEWHNFEALNIPLAHPARDPLDNFFLEAAPGINGPSGPGRLMLRSQTSTVQIRTMEQTAPPLRIIAVGRCYRPDTVDATHSFMFHQLEGLMVGSDVTMADLKTVLRLFATAYLGRDVHIRFRPSFFPFTEPSVEVDMSWGQGGQSWMELGGAGMVDPHVLQSVGYDPERLTGFAFGLGIERLAMRRYGIDDIRLFYENDGRFLRQF